MSEDYSVTEILSVDLEQEGSEYSQVSPPHSPTTPAQKWAARSRARWASDGSSPEAAPLSPSERAQRRIEAERRRLMEEQQSIRNEAERQARLKFEREESLRKHMSEEERRKAILAEDLRRAASERKLREQLWQEEEEERQRLLEERRRLTRERKLQEARQLQESMEREKEKRGAEERAAAEKKRWAEQERAARLRDVQQQFSAMTTTSGIVLAGWVSVQTTDQLVWRRRWFEMSSGSIGFMKDPNENAILDSIELSHVKAVCEWQDGFEELKAIPTAFAIVFNDGHGPWSFYSDTPKDKDIFMGMLLKTAGLAS